MITDEEDLDWVVFDGLEFRMQGDGLNVKY